MKNSTALRLVTHMAVLALVRRTCYEDPDRSYFEYPCAVLQVFLTLSTCEVTGYISADSNLRDPAHTYRQWRPKSELGDKIQITS
ncbi:MAG: hypothetical protein QM784_09390 [Polyangiaceae bacterium]